jgi:hypothetical protein
MKLVKQNGKGLQYLLNADEAKALCFLVGEFPFTRLTPAKISKSDSDAEEREKLLNESLAKHRKELKQKARTLVSGEKFKAAEGKQIYRISLQARETMLQILNDIRVESWRMLGEPEDLDSKAKNLPKEQFRYYVLMCLAGEFEYHFLNLDQERR